jgi:DNA (cytosine-5)-methyltransferase 1
MRVLDLFCNAGGAATGYARAGFEVIGVDINPQPNYPYRFHQADALMMSLAEYRRGFAFVHASPPCQHSAAITKGTNQHRQHLHPNLYPQTKALLERIGLPYALENPDSRPDVVLCGEMFGLGVLRHRNLELGGWSTARPKHPKHRGYVRGMRHGVWREGPYVAVYGKGGGKATVPEAQKAMGIDWTDRHEELVEMLPPAYTEWIGRRFLEWKT